MTTREQLMAAWNESRDGESDRGVLADYLEENHLLALASFVRDRVRLPSHSEEMGNLNDQEFHYLLLTPGRILPGEEF